MSITRKRRKGEFEAEAALARLQAVAREQADRLGPYAGQARDTAGRRLLQARGWTAPRLEIAAHRVEDTVAPRVADLLSLAAHQVEPAKKKRKLLSTKRGGRRIPSTVVFVGAATLGTAAVYGVLKLRQAAQDAEWQENLDQARDQVRETRDKLSSTAKDTASKVSGTAEEVQADAAEAKDTAATGAKESAQDLNGHAKK